MASQQVESRFFVARLPGVDPVLREILENWGAKDCVALRIETQGEESSVFIARKTPTTARKLQRNMRGIAAGRNAPLPALGNGWLRPVTEESFHCAPRERADKARDDLVDALAELPDQDSASHSTPPTHKACTQPQSTRGEPLLSPDFDERGYELLQRHVKSGAIRCC